MPEADREQLSAALDAAPADPGPLFALLDENVAWDVRAFPDGALYHGPAGVQAFFESWAGAFEDFGFEAEDLIQAGDSIVVPLRQWGRGKETGIPVEGHTWQVFTFLNGRIIRCVGYTTRAEALEAAGLPE